jgi:hypothetical protein
VYEIAIAVLSTRLYNANGAKRPGAACADLGSVVTM